MFGHRARTPYQNRVSLYSFYYISKVGPRDHSYIIASRPLLCFAASVNAISGPIGIQREVFERAGKPKEWVELMDHHLTNYLGASFEKHMEV